MATPARLETAGGLPPQEFWLVDPKSKTFEPIPTPTDDRRLILVDELISAVMPTIAPEYGWRTGPKDVNEHHLRWPKRDYKRMPWRPNTDNPRFFWNLPTERAILPIQFHNWLHEVTEPPPVPKKEVRRLRAESWRVAYNLFNKVDYGVKKLQSEGLLPEVKEEDQIAIEYMTEALERNFMGVERYLESMRRIPQELRVLQPYDEAHALAVELGSVSLKRPRNLVSVVAGDQLERVA